MTTAFGDQAVPMMTSANNIGVGWHPLVRELEEKLNAIDPNFELLQIKEKFGGLRYYANSDAPGFHDAINLAEAKSFTICEICGESGECKATVRGSWIKTLCDTHRAEDQAQYQAEGSS